MRKLEEVEDMTSYYARNVSRCISLTGEDGDKKGRRAA